MTVAGREKGVAVTGMGGCCAAGNTLAEIREGLRCGRANTISVPTNLYRGELDCPVYAAGEVTLSSGALQLLENSPIAIGPDRLNPTVILVLNVLAEALADSGLDPEQLRSRRIGIALGTTVGCTFNDEEYFLDWRRGKTAGPASLYRYLEAHLAGLLQKILGVQGPVTVITNACASGTDAVGVARNWLLGGTCDIALAGGSDALARSSYYGFAALMLMAGSPCRPYDRNRSGLSLGEGAALVVMEREGDAALRRGQVYGRVCGYGSASDCYHPIAPHPEGRGLQAALAKALDDAKVSPRQVSFVNGHGTGTLANDAAEMRALALMGLTSCPVVSTKGLTGHMLGAAGAMETIFTLLTLAQGTTRGSANCLEPDPALDLRSPPETEVTSLKGRLGVSQSLAFGGTNSALVLEA